MSLPTLTTEIAFVSNPMGSQTWTDVSAYVQEWSIKRGRQYELDRIEAGEATIILTNPGQLFDPEYAGGAYYETIWPMRRIRITASWHEGGPMGPDYETILFTGFIESWQPSWPDKKNSVIEVKAVDGFKVLAQAKLNTSYSSEKIETRINNILDSISWSTGNVWILDSATNSQLGTSTILGPAGDRLVDEGQSTLQAITLADVTSLQHLQDVVDSEMGMAFISGEGVFIFHGRHRLYHPPYTESQATFGDVDPYIRYIDLEYAFDDGKIYNDVRVTRTGGIEQTASNAASQTKYLKRTLARNNMHMTTDTEAKDQADFLLAQYKDLIDAASGLPVMRIPQIAIDIGDNSPSWYNLLARDLGDRVTINRKAPISLSHDHRIEGISHQIKGKVWTVTFQLSPIDSAGFWILDDAIYSVLGSTTRLAA